MQSTAVLTLEWEPTGPVEIRCRGPWVNVNATVDEHDSDMGGGAVYHDNRVRVEEVR